MPRISIAQRAYGNAIGFESHQQNFFFRIGFNVFSHYKEIDSQYLFTIRDKTQTKNPIESSSEANDGKNVKLVNRRVFKFNSSEKCVRCLRKKDE